MRGLIAKILLVFFALIISTISGELLVRRFAPQLTFSSAVRLSFDCFSSDQLIPFSLRSNHQCRLKDRFTEYDVLATINSKGYRNKEFEEKKPAGVKRILVLGDSITFGQGVADKDTYPSQLEQILKENKISHTEVINAGYADGFSIDSYYLYLKKRGLELKPDAVIVGFFVWNDMTDLSETIWERTDKNGLPEKITSNIRVIDSGVVRKKKIEFKYRYPYLRESHLFLFLTDVLQKKYNFFDTLDVAPKRDLYQGCILTPVCIDVFREEEEKTYTLIKEMKKMTDANGIDFLVILFPVDIQLYPEGGWKYGFLQYPPADDKNFIQKRLSKWFTDNGIKYLDLYPVFDSQRERGLPFFLNDAHLSVLGNRMSAEAIANYLQENKMIN